MTDACAEKLCPKNQMDVLEGENAVIEDQIQGGMVLEFDQSMSFFRRSSIGNPYIAKQIARTRLFILQKQRATNAFRAQGHVGLMHLFCPSSQIDTYRQYTNEKLLSLGPKKAASVLEFNAYIGLELAMSIVKFNQITDYWCNSTFLGHQDFKSTMSRTRFMQIRSSLKLKANIMAGEVQSGLDPLYSARRFLNCIMKAFAAIAVPLGTVALDEAGCRSKARNRAVSYLPSKPDPFAKPLGNPCHYCVVPMLDERGGPYGSASRDQCDPAKGATDSYDPVDVWVGFSRP